MNLKLSKHGKKAAGTAFFFVISFMRLVFIIFKFKTGGFAKKYSFAKSYGGLPDCIGVSPNGLYFLA